MMAEKKKTGEFKKSLEENKAVSVNLSKPDKNIKAQDIKFIEDVVKNVSEDFSQRASERRAYEAQWQLNSNFLLGNQYCSVSVSGDVEDTERDYFWQEREVFNHIAPIIETRLAKLGRVRPKMSVRPSSDTDEDLKTAKLSGKILNGTCSKLEFDKKISNATYWSELCGTSFYKITWDINAGKKVGSLNGRDIYEGDIRVDICPPYEIFPSSLNCQSVDECQSIIHAKAVSVEEIKRIWGVEVKPSETEVVSYSDISLVGGLGMSSAIPTVNRSFSDNSCIVIERYTMPTVENPNGELVIIAGDKLLFYGELPYINGEDGRRTLPFVKQDSLVRGGCFYGMSIVERAIPIQRAYNAVKNRKHEFMNRIAMGVMAVEDGSVDTENLVEEGLSPGKILVYRQGSTPPRLLDSGRVPADFNYEEDRLLHEFNNVSGVSEFMRNSTIPSTLTSGIALQMLVEQDDTRLSISASLIRSAIKQVAKHILRLYKQFCTDVRLARVTGSEGETEIICWNASDISCDDVIFETENELNSTPAAQQNMMFELLKMGLLHDENGKLPSYMRYKILDVLGYGGFELTRDTAALHAARAEKENANAVNIAPNVIPIDDHNLHNDLHIKFVLSADFDKLLKKNENLLDIMLNHINEHKLSGAKGTEEPNINA